MIFFNELKEQVLYLQELGVENLAVAIPEKTSESHADSVAEKADIPEIVLPKAPPTRKPADSRLKSLPTLGDRVVPKSKVQSPMSKAVPGGTVEQVEHMGQSKTPESLFAQALTESGETIEQIRADIGDCTRCPLHTGRTQVVHTTGNFHADLMFIGEAPGGDEDEQGFPFVGRAGQLLTKIIEAIGMKREEVAIGNINRCRPPGNRAPERGEAEICKRFLLREIAVIQPKVIVVLGNTALHNLLDTKVGITKLRGQFQDHFGVKVMPTFHPAFLLRDPRKKAEVWEDMKKVRDFLIEN